MLLQAINQKLNNSNNLSSPTLLYVGCGQQTGHSQQNIRWEYESDIFICNGSIEEVIYDFDVILFPVSSLGRLWARPQHLG